MDSLFSYLNLDLHECQYGTASAQEQLKDQLVFGVTVHDIQENLLRTLKIDEWD